MEFSTLRSKYPSLKPSNASRQNPFHEPQDEKSRRLKLQEQVQFREKFHLETDYELIYTMPQQRLYILMHFVCTCVVVIMIVFVAMQFHRDMLDFEPLTSEINPQIPQYAIYTVAALIGTAFAASKHLPFHQTDFIVLSQI